MEELDELKWRFEKLKNDASIFRKQGKDVKIAELILMQVPVKIRMAEITKQQKDIGRVTDLIEEAQSEIDESAGHNEAFTLLCEQRIAQINEALSKEDIYMASLLYNQVRRYYRELKKDEKKKFVQQFISLYAELVKARETEKHKNA